MTGVELAAAIVASTSWPAAVVAAALVVRYEIERAFDDAEAGRPGPLDQADQPPARRRARRR